ncbi:Aste57867_4700 [Aphanomyces stellatus]|uniref:Aste57867_4700 protein n=1 Tax=Aphanomyces stellatus TaxID=120398 RepID=A0A485KG98_9STRA|nr:hypothetical protein As57867_004687 [Aphanomyces stellatus]VFT81800.1 Aste57867_4700 [Aphanomyces stellatus]
MGDLLNQCKDSIPSIVIYGLPDKDCGDGGFSQGGANKNADMYKAWIQKLVDQVGTREVIYVFEPDAIGLVAANGCGVQKGYLANMKMALGLLASNPNAHIYADVASWADQAGAIKALNDLKSAGNLKGVAINTSNYRGTSELNALCQTYSSATGGLHCVFDVSRNFNGSPQNEWCNAKSAGMGSPPTAETGNPLVDYHLWIKVPGESDGECTGRGPDAAVGPSAGAFFYDGFKSMWNQGYYVKEKKLPVIGGNWPAPSSSSPSPSTASPVVTPAPSSASPATTASPPGTTPYVEPTTASPSKPTTSSPPSPPNTTSSPATPSPSSNGSTAQPWAQCGGAQFDGPTQCASGYTCKKWHDAYSQCISAQAQAGESETWGQCGGKGYTGPTKCKVGDKCDFKNDYYHQCVPV